MKWPWENKDAGAGRRHHERCRVRLPCKIIILEKTFLGTSVDLSLGGVLVQLPVDVAFADDLLGKGGCISVLLPNGDLEMECQTIRRVGTVIGVEFMGIKNTALEKRLLDYLETQLGEVW